MLLTVWTAVLERNTTNQWQNLCPKKVLSHEVSPVSLHFNAGIKVSEMQKYLRKAHFYSSSTWYSSIRLAGNDWGNWHKCQIYIINQTTISLKCYHSKSIKYSAFLDGTILKLAPLFTYYLSEDNTLHSSCKQQRTRIRISTINLTIGNYCCSLQLRVIKCSKV